MEKITLKDKFEMFSDYWSPKIISELNGQHVKLVKVKGELIWHNHANEDELFYVIKGSLRIHFRDCEKIINQGEMIIVPKGVDHKPVSDGETWLMLIEPQSIKHTGDSHCDKTINDFTWI